MDFGTCIYRLAESVRLMMALSIFLSYSLQFYVPMDIMWPAIKSRIPTEKMQLISEYAFRTCLVLLTCKFIPTRQNGLISIARIYVKSYNRLHFFTVALAELIPNLGLFISLVGAVSSSTLALIFPPMINILTSWSNGYGKYRWELWKDIAVMIFGTLGFIAGSYVSMERILQGGAEA